ncbi:golgin subfamily A member 6-like protein 22 [Talpa occidentalis]|uniref:golgin subfamily A member 6-like protein 22 n=1 Tax=Talpa occidentalis TaxID=50954 RepID=UPI001890148F|nr:golgin subfamily A member 6-like protein 22 [Talpa occidentalis]XP_037374910.1 golgin subfamily A member 6-like protein 22 [Talpa occidentalis]XP_037374911.1 golgin subfamily A member 6-like protein 22 [Talpa occidentalis]XP_037374912.1 golgin subfamily A member 6-like protein 22 [Talpa occidentalis]
MASAPTNKRKREEATCSICQQPMTEPVSFDCGHSFCHQCIEGSIEEQQETSGEQPGISGVQPGRKRPRWGRWASDYRLLRASMREEVIGHLDEYINAAGKELEGERLCEEHGEKLCLYCEDTGQLICSGCAQCPEHSGHNHVLAEDLCLRSKKKLQEAVTKLRELLHQSRSMKLSTREQTREWQDMKDTVTRSSVAESASSEPHTDRKDSELHCDESKKLKTDEGGAWASVPAAKRIRMEAMCPICHELTTDPVSFSFGHSCCHGHIVGSVKEQQEESLWSLDCPSCQADLEMDRDLLRTLDRIEVELELEHERPWEGHGNQPHQVSEDTGQLMCRGSAWSPQYSGHNHLVKATGPGSEENRREAETKLLELLDPSKIEKLVSSEQTRELEEKIQEAKTKLRELLDQSKGQKLKSKEQRREQEEKLQEGVTKLRDLVDQWLSLKLKYREQRREWEENLQDAMMKLRDLLVQSKNQKLKSGKQICEWEEKHQDSTRRLRELLDLNLSENLKSFEQEEKLLETRTKVKERLDQWLSQKVKSREQTREQEDVKDTLKRSRSSVPESVSSEPHTDCNDSDLHCEERKRLKTDEGGATASAPAAKTSGEQPGTSEEQPGTLGEQSASRRCPFYHPSIQQSVIKEFLQRLDEAISAAPKDVEGEKLCEIHAVRLRLFCEDTGQLICKFCARFRKHRGHKHVRAKNACLRSKEKLQEAVTKPGEQGDQCDSLKLSTGEQTKELEDMKDTLTRSSVPESASSEPHIDCNDSELHCDESKKLKTDKGEQPETSEEDLGTSDEDSWISDEDSWISDEDSWMSDDDSWMSDDDSLMSDVEPGTSDEELGTSDEEPGTSDEEPGIPDKEPGTSEEEPGKSEEESGKTSQRDSG